MSIRFSSSKSFLCSMLLLALSVAPALAHGQSRGAKKPAAPQPAPDRISTDVAARFIGIWTAEFNEMNFLRLELALNNGKLTGKIATGDIHTAPDGRLIDVSTPKESTPVFDVSIASDVLTFKRHNESDVDQFQMTLTSAGTAELRFVLPESAPRVQPFQLTRRIETSK